MQKAAIKNDFLLCRVALRMYTNPSSLWATILTSKYGTESRPRKFSSITWNGTHRCWSLCKDAIFWAISDGTRVNAWNNRWIPGMPPLASILHGPHHISQISLLVKDIWKDEAWYFGIFLMKSPLPPTSPIAFKTLSCLIDSLAMTPLSGG